MGEGLVLVIVRSHQSLYRSIVRRDKGRSGG